MKFIAKLFVRPVHQRTRLLTVAALALTLAAGCVTRQEVASIVNQSNSAILAAQLGIDTELRTNPALQDTEDAVSQRIDAFIATHPDQTATASALRVRQAVYQLGQKNYELARSAFDAAVLTDLHSERDQALKELAPHVIWWSKAAPQWMERPELRGELPNADRALAAFDEQIVKRATNPRVRDFLAEMRAWIGLKFAEAGADGPEIGRRLGNVIDQYTSIFDADDLLWFADPNAEVLTPNSGETRRRLRAKPVLQDAQKQLEQLEADDRPVLSEKSRAVMESGYLLRPF